MKHLQIQRLPRIARGEDVLERVYDLQLLVICYHAPWTTPPGDKRDFRSREAVAVRISCEVFQSVVANLIARSLSVFGRDQHRRPIQNMLSHLLFGRGRRHNPAAPSFRHALVKFGRDLPFAEQVREDVHPAAVLRDAPRRGHSPLHEFRVCSWGAKKT
jgi:hypothetical protein